MSRIFILVAEKPAGIDSYITARVRLKCWMGTRGQAKEGRGSRAKKGVWDERFCGSKRRRLRRNPAF